MLSSKSIIGVIIGLFQDLNFIIGHVLGSDLIIGHSQCSCVIIGHFQGSDIIFGHFRCIDVIIGHFQCSHVITGLPEGWSGRRSAVANAPPVQINRGNYVPSAGQQGQVAEFQSRLTIQFSEGNGTPSVWLAGCRWMHDAVWWTHWRLSGWCQVFCHSTWLTVTPAPTWNGPVARSKCLNLAKILIRN